MEGKLEVLERRVEELEETNTLFHVKVRELEIEMEKVIRKLKVVPDEQSYPFDSKLNYLTEVNEQMFQQNVRLRQYIENCIHERTIPTHQQYNKALQGE